MSWNQVERDGASNDWHQKKIWELVAVVVVSCTNPSDRKCEANWQ